MKSSAKFLRVQSALPRSGSLLWLVYVFFRSSQQTFVGQERVTNPKERLRGRLKTLGIYLDEHLNWKTQIAPVQGKLTKNLGILYQLRNYLNLKMLRQLYYALINPYLNYGAMCWGNTYQPNLNKICTKQNKCIRVFFCKQTRALSPILPNPWNFKMLLLIHNLLIGI